MTTPDQYAQAVREALAGHPEREELLEDLDDHLAEIAAESDVPLEQRLGPPETYAEELLAAYEERSPRARGRRSRLRESAGAWRARLLEQEVYRSLTGFLAELRPGWWVLRGYVLGLFVLTMLTGPRLLVPDDLFGWALVAVAVWASVWMGRRARGVLVVTVATALNLAGVLVLAVAVMGAEYSPDPDVAYATARAPVPALCPAPSPSASPTR
ncbi:hypothetical protein [Nonomuraea rhizosphaerae]|uniref:hypothetical protein n=1 Tax=Nonomuraea rhizosphaerae TaxID=2665663 RepID=UPI001C5E2E85|nr:hypothetical protein [Nonomuraea rhizosphaerae]